MDPTHTSRNNRQPLDRLIIPAKCRALKLNGGEWLVLVNLASRAGPKGECWPSTATIARDTGLTPRGVTKILRRLQAASVVGIIQSPGGRRRTNRYQVLSVSHWRNPERGDRVSAARNPEPGVPETLNAGSRNPEPGAPETLNAGSPRKSKEKELNRKTKEKEGCGADSAARSADQSHKPTRRQPNSEGTTGSAGGEVVFPHRNEGAKHPNPEPGDRVFVGENLSPLPTVGQMEDFGPNGFGGWFRTQHRNFWGTDTYPWSEKDGEAARQAIGTFSGLEAAEWVFEGWKMVKERGWPKSTISALLSRYRKQRWAIRSFEQIEVEAWRNGFANAEAHRQHQKQMLLGRMPKYPVVNNEDRGPIPMPPIPDPLPASDRTSVGRPPCCEQSQWTSIVNAGDWKKTRKLIELPLHGRGVIGTGLKLRRHFGQTEALRLLDEVLATVSEDEARRIHATTWRFGWPPGFGGKFLTDWQERWADLWKRHGCSQPKDADCYMGLMADRFDEDDELYAAHAARTTPAPVATAIP